MVWAGCNVLKIKQYQYCLKAAPVSVGQCHSSLDRCGAPLSAAALLGLIRQAVTFIGDGKGR